MNRSLIPVPVHLNRGCRGKRCRHVGPAGDARRPSGRHPNTPPPITASRSYDKKSERLTLWCQKEGRSAVTAATLTLPSKVAPPNDRD